MKTFEFHRFIILSIFVLISGCGGGSIGENNINNNKNLKDFLYANHQTQLVYVDNSQISQKNQSTLQSFGLTRALSKGYSLFEISFKYKDTNLPQNSLHITNGTNKKLLVYNHGHGGLPLASESYAGVLLDAAVDNGYDILLVSMPLVGLNRIDTTEQYWARLYGSDRISVFDNLMLANAIPYHSIYETIADRDNFLHYFVDPSVMFPAATSRFSSVDTPRPRFVFGNVPANYESFSYVGLSGGGGTGLIACAVFKFDKCILIAGFLPLYLRASSIKSWGDSEQITNAFYSTWTYEKLMELAHANSSGVVFIYNKADPCCFSAPEASMFKADFAKYDIRVVDLNIHGYDPTYILNELTR